MNPMRRLMVLSVVALIVFVAQVSGEAVCPGPGGEKAQPLTVVVTDPQGGRVPGASVIAECGVGFRRDAQSGDDGTATFDLAPGRYRVVVTMAGLAPTATDVVVAAGTPGRVAVALDVAPRTEAVTVHGRELARRTTTATKTDTPLLETPQSVSVITADQIRDQASPNLQEAVRYTAGVRNEGYGIDNRGDWLFLRGSDDSTTLVDGLRLPLAGWWGVIRVEPYAYERIEVLRGPSSIIAGQNDPGGVVGLVSKRPETETSRRLGLGLGNYDRREIRGDVTGRIRQGSSWLYRLVGLARDGNTQIQHADEKRVLLAPSLTWRPDERRSVTVFGEYQYDRSKNTNAFLGLEGTLRPAPHGPIPTDVFIGEPDWDRYGGTRWRFGYAADYALGHGWQLRHQARHDEVSGLMKSMYATWWNGFLDADGSSDPNGRYLGRAIYANEDSLQVSTGEVLVQGRWNTGSLQHTTIFGVDGLLHDASTASADGTGAPLNVYDPVYGVVAEPFLDDATPTKGDIRRLGFLAQDQAKVFGRLSLRAGVRRDSVRNEVVGSDVARDSATSVNFGLVYELRPGLAPYASYSESFNPVSGTDFAGASFKPKRGEQVEAGLKWESPSARFGGAAAVYTIKEKNRLANDPLHVDYSVQIGEARIRGVELEGKGSFGSWNALGSYTYTRVRATAAAFGGDLNVNEQIEGVPEHQASVWATHDFSRLGVKGVKLGGGVRRVGRIGDGTGAVFVPAVTIFDAVASYDAGRWHGALNFNNLTDKAYIATCLARGDCWFGARRSITASVDVRF